MEQILLEFKKVGFSQYEAKAYVTLLQHSPITGYELSKRSGVPRSMIYEVLGKLVDRGAVHQVPSEPIKYAPVPPKDLIQRLRRDLTRTLDYLEEEMDSLDEDSDLDVIWHIRGYKSVIDEITAVIEKSQEECWLSIWEPQYESVKPYVEALIQRDIRVFSILFGTEEKRLGWTFHHNYMAPEVVEERMGGRLTIVARDHKEVIIASFSERGTPWAVKTTDPALVQVAIEYIRHDIMIEEMTRELGSEKLDQLWRNNSVLTQVVTGKRFTE